MRISRRTILKGLAEAPGRNSATTQYMNGTMEADVDAKSVNCPCCGDQMERKGSRLCSDCETEGCDPSTSLCMKDLGGA